MKRAAETGWAAAMRAFSFPLNVYAHLLQQVEGQADYLHFAVFEPGQNDVRRAQERASELLWQALPPPCRLLEVGIGLGTTLARLRAAGYDAHGITPEPAQIDAAHARHGTMPANGKRCCSRRARSTSRRWRCSRLPSACSWRVRPLSW